MKLSHVGSIRGRYWWLSAAPSSTKEKGTELLVLLWKARTRVLTFSASDRHPVRLLCWCGSENLQIDLS
jgi:hypothetical protein